METRGRARMAEALVPGKGVSALVQGEMEPVGRKHPATGLLVGVVLGPTCPCLHVLQPEVISAVPRFPGMAYLQR